MFPSWVRHIAIWHKPMRRVSTLSGPQANVVVQQPTGQMSTLRNHFSAFPSAPLSIVCSGSGSNPWIKVFWNMQHKANIWIGSKSYCILWFGRSNMQQRRHGISIMAAGIVEMPSHCSIEKLSLQWRESVAPVCCGSFFWHHLRMVSFPAFFYFDNRKLLTFSACQKMAWKLDIQRMAPHFVDKKAFSRFQRSILPLEVRIVQSYDESLQKHQNCWGLVFSDATMLSLLKFNKSAV